jgi:hypothetical protein
MTIFPKPTNLQTVKGNRIQAKCISDAESFNTDDICLIYNKEDLALMLSMLDVCIITNSQRNRDLKCKNQ